MKTSKLTSVLVVASLAFSVSTIHAQTNHSFHAGICLPVGDLADDDVTTQKDAGGLGLGFNLGAKLIFPFSESGGLGAFAAVDLNMNPLKKDAEEALEKAIAQDPSQVDFEHAKFWHFPISVGLNYTGELGNGISLFGSGGLAMELMKPTSFEASIQQTTFEQEYDMSNKMGLRFGGGIQFNENLKVEVTYFGIGEMEIEGDSSLSDGQQNQNQRFEFDQPVNFFTITFGYVLP